MTKDGPKKVNDVVSPVVKVFSFHIVCYSNLNIAKLLYRFFPVTLERQNAYETQVR